MVNSTNTGGPAFPVSHDMALIVGLQNAYGMTLRDYFAATAMQGELAAQSTESVCWTNLDALAVLAYQMADAMLKAREQ